MNSETDMKLKLAFPPPSALLGNPASDALRRAGTCKRRGRLGALLNAELQEARLAGGKAVAVVRPQVHSQHGRLQHCGERGRRDW